MKKANFKGIQFDEPLTDVSIISICPYCNKRFLNSNSYRNHVLKGYCPLCDSKTGKYLGNDIKILLNLLGGRKDV